MMPPRSEIKEQIIDFLFHSDSQRRKVHSRQWAVLFIVPVAPSLLSVAEGAVRAEFPYQSHAHTIHRFYVNKELRDSSEEISAVSEKQYSVRNSMVISMHACWPSCHIPLIPEVLAAG